MLKARVDANQKAIVKALRDAGMTVQHLHGVGQGCPDLVVGYSHNGKKYNVLLEIKEKDGRLTPQQIIWHSGWRGQVSVVSSAEEAVKVVLDYGKQ
jgi:hypothetical protein